MSELESIREQVGRKLGWTGPVIVGSVIAWNDPQGNFHILPNYSRDIDAAWEIVEAVNLAHERYFTLFKNGIYYSAVWSGDKSYGEFARGEGNTPALAICNAFLKLPEKDQFGGTLWISPSPKK